MNIIQKARHEIEDYKVLLRNTPAVTLVFFVLSVVFMNIFASKELLNIDYLALDCGFLLSWMSFLCMDMLTKRFGARAAIKLSLFAVFCNLMCCGIFKLVSVIGNHWAQFYDSGDVADAAINSLMGGTWYVIVGSMIAFIVSAIFNAIINAGIGKIRKKDNFLTYALRSYVSTATGQFIDNLVFATLVSKVFFGWTWTQVILCSVVGAVAELLSEVVFSPVGFRVCKKWQSEKIGDEYINYSKNAA